MSDPAPDLRHAAIQYRDHLRAELEKVEQFLAMADHISKASESLSSGVPDLQESDGSQETGGQSVNFFSESD